MNITEKRLQIYDRVLSTLSVISLLIGGLWTLSGFVQAKNKENLLIKQQIDMAVFNDKKAVYYELCDAESTIAACNSYEEVVIAQKNFRKLYLGKAHMIAQLDTAVNNQKIDFMELLDTYLRDKPQESPFEYFGSAALELADICQSSLDVNRVYKLK